MTLSALSQELLPEIENELKQSISHPLIVNSGLSEMLTYHLGWTGEGAGPEASGKRIRPLLTLLSTEIAGGDWRSALPAAASVELIHNFSLIHDDIQDGSQSRRGRKTVWAQWGQPHAINAGDLMFTLAFASLDRLKNSFPADMVLNAQTILHETCIALTKGQFLDMSFERAQKVSLDDYWTMINGKTAALLAASTQLGALCAGVDIEKQVICHQFGRFLGLAFQVWDDWLGIWGNVTRTGKSTSSDLVSGKKTYPIVFGLTRQGKFAKRWNQGPVKIDEVGQIMELLSEDGAEVATLNMARELTEEAMNTLNLLASDRPAFHALRELCTGLLNRQN